MHKHCFFNTSISQCDTGKNSHCRSARSLLSLLASCSSGMQHQRMLPSILRGHFFDIISGSGIRISVLDIFNQPKYTVAIIILNSSIISSFLSSSRLHVFGF